MVISTISNTVPADFAAWADWETWLPVDGTGGQTGRAISAETLAGWVINVSNAATQPLIMEVDPSVRHNGESLSGHIIDNGGTETTLITVSTSDCILQDFWFQASPGDALVYTIGGTVSDVVVRRNVFHIYRGLAGRSYGVQNPRAFVAWFNLFILDTVLGGLSLGTKSGVGSAINFNTVYVLSGMTVAHHAIDVAGIDKAYGNIVKAVNGADMTGANEYTGVPTSSSHNMGDDATIPGTDPYDVGTLGITDLDLFKSDDASNVGRNPDKLGDWTVPNRSADAGYVNRDIKYHEFDPDAMVVGAEQIDTNPPSTGAGAIAYYSRGSRPRRSKRYNRPSYRNVKIH